jgi:hypothetical protein
VSPSLRAWADLNTSGLRIDDLRSVQVLDITNFSLFAEICIPIKSHCGATETAVIVKKLSSTPSLTQGVFLVNLWLGFCKFVLWTIAPGV